MMKKIISLLLFLIGAVGASAQDNGHWQCDIHAYEFDMTVYYTLVYNDKAVSDMANYDVAAFVGDECRGVGEVQTVSLTGGNTASYGYIRIRSNQKNGETITLMAYDKTLDMECHINETVAFNSQSLIGTPSSPTSFTFYDERPVTVKMTNTSREYGDANPNFEFTVEGPELIGVPTITCEANASTNVGTYAITATRGTIKNVNVTLVDGMLTITKAPLTIGGGQYSIKQGDPMPQFTATYAGFKNNETEDVLIKKPTLTCEATSASSPGTYDITVAGAEAKNYEITYEKGVLTINEADPVTITAKNCSREYGESNPAFEYTSEGATLSGIPEITCEATPTSPVGSYPIKVAKGSVTNYNVTFVDGTLTVTKAPLTISGGKYTIRQGDPLPQFEATYSGFKINETEEVLANKPTLTCEATSASSPGTYDIVVAGAEAQNYEITYVKGTLTITEADAIIVTAKSYSREYGEANPAFEFTTEGAQLSGTPEISCDATETSPVGSYPIKITKGTITNYNVTYVDGTLTVNKAPLTITGGTYSIKQGDPLPEFAVTYSGFKNNETEEVLTKKPTLTCVATSASAPGTYDITVAGAEAQNYEITYVKGTLTITEADPVTVTAKSCSREYGEANPEFEYTTEGAPLSGTPEISCEATKASPVGTYTIKVTRGTVTNYNVTFVDGTLTVTKAPLTISGGQYVIKQGAPLPNFVATYSGFKNNETDEVLTTKPTMTCEATSASSPGTYDIIVSGAEAQNYEITYVKGTLTITEADAIIVTAKSCSREYGEANPSFEYTTDGEQLSGTPEISCEATETSPVGTYPINITRGTVTNYNVTFVDGILTVTKAPLTITGGTYTIKQGDPLPEFAVTYSGFKNNETEEVLTKKPTLTCEATSESTPGTYDIIVAGAEAQNYEITYVKGTLTIEGKGVMLGDVNGDGFVNVTDIVEIVYYIMEQPSEIFNFEAADVNQDGFVNVTDIVEIVDMIMKEDN